MNQHTMNQHKVCVDPIDPSTVVWKLAPINGRIMLLAQKHKWDWFEVAEIADTIKLIEDPHLSGLDIRLDNKYRMVVE